MLGVDGLRGRRRAAPCRGHVRGGRGASRAGSGSGAARRGDGRHRDARRRRPRPAPAQGRAGRASRSASSASCLGVISVLAGRNPHRGGLARRGDERRAKAHRRANAEAPRSGVTTSGRVAAPGNAYSPHTGSPANAVTIAAVTAATSASVASRHSRHERRRPSAPSGGLALAPVGEREHARVERDGLRELHQPRRRARPRRTGGRCRARRGTRGTAARRRGRPAAARWPVRPLPPTRMFWPSCCLSADTASTTSPSIRCEFCHSTLSSVRRGDVLGQAVHPLGEPASSVISGQAAANPS